MPNNPICEDCGKGCVFPCGALNKLGKIYIDLRTEEKTQIISDLRKELDIRDYEIADDIRNLGEKVIKAMPELSIIPEFNIKVGYVRSYETKQAKGKQINADCRKVNGTYTAYLPFDFIITFYEPNMGYMNENQKKILMLHELKHIGLGERGLRIENHDVEDFKDILYRFGIDWNEFNQDCPDILAGGDNGQEDGRKRQKMETKHKAGTDGRASAKSR
jgi:hypothetical protein